MAHCSRCGAKLPAGARFCPACGAGVKDAPAGGDAAAAGGGSGWKWLGLLALLAAVVVGAALWQQRDGARPVATETSDTPGNDTAPAASVDLPPAVLAPEPAPLPTPTPTPAPPPVLPAPALDSEMASDPAGTPARYPGPLAIRGIVRAVDLEGDVPVATLGGRAPGAEVVVRFAPGEEAAAELLQPDMAVRLTCAGVHAEEEQTVLDACRL